MDRETVIKKAERITRSTVDRDMIDSFCEDVIALLKEQEAKQIDLYGNDEWWGLVCICPDCKAEWMSDKANTHYCPNCGIRVKWE